MPGPSTAVKHILDPEGDTVLILSDPNARFIDFDPKEVVASVVNLPAIQARATTSDRWKPAESVDAVHFRVSSKHLKTASFSFREKSSSQWKDVMLTSWDDEFTIHTREWNETALLIVMNIIHGRGYQVPNEVSIELMAQIAEIVDYHGCHKTCSFHYRTWLSNPGFQRAVAESTGRDMLLTLIISSVFDEALMRETISDRMARSSRSHIDGASLKVPIPDSVFGKLSYKVLCC